MKVFVSPHFDDAIGSSGCLIHSLVAAAEEVQILTIFAGEHDGNISEFARKMLSIWHLRNGVTERALENAEACSILGTKDLNFLFIEALYRKDIDWLYPFDGDLFGPIKSFDMNLPRKIADEIANNFGKETVFFFPGGRGKHVDHLLVKQAGEILYSKGFRVWFYTDFSYTGEINKGFKMRKIVKKFNMIDLNVKIRAFNAYKSQLQMLFKSDDASEYFFKENLSKEGEVYEEYYEIIG